MKHSPLKIVADENIPALDELFPDSEILRRPGRGMKPADLQGADALLVRSVTQVNRDLLDGSNIKFVGTCTIGTDHIDQVYLQEQGIGFSSAPGCNADAVVDYVMAAMLFTQANMSEWQAKQAAVLGYGQVGKRLVERLLQCGIAVICYDPFQQAALTRRAKSSEEASQEAGQEVVKARLSVAQSYQDLLTADLISIHTPLSFAEETSHPTYQLFDAKLLQQLKPDALLINAARGPVVDNQALAACIDQGRLCSTILDVYQQEPEPPLTLLDKLALSTSHIAGYSVQGKLRGSVMIAEALLAHFSGSALNVDLLAKTKVTLSVEACLEQSSCAPSLASLDQILAAIVCNAYNIDADTKAFKQVYCEAYRQGGAEAGAKAFDHYRKHYPQRYEFGFTELVDWPSEISGARLSALQLALKQIGFIVNA